MTLHWAIQKNVLIIKKNLILERLKSYDRDMILNNFKLSRLDPKGQAVFKLAGQNQAELAQLAMMCLN